MMAVDDPETWASDEPISLPEPLTQHRYVVPMDGFVFTEHGIYHGVYETDLEEMKHPTYGPERAGDV